MPFACPFRRYVRSPSRLAISIGLCFIPAVAGWLFTAPAIGSWYRTLNKPWFTPPDWVFGPVWTVLYLLMGICLYRIWMHENHKDLRLPVALFSIQLTLNALWSFLFFGLRAPILGLFGIILLWFTILATIVAIYPVDRKAAYDLIPYILWVTLAAALNFAVYVLNP
ncbi:MAG: tryptophan-rich sensory protein [Methanomicrobiales archaeon]|nr:tryptophan-rich sensory protein [Methanomicrobiales archaeon]